MPVKCPEAFDKLTPEASYWVGFLLADGSLYTQKGRRHPVLELCIMESDRRHLEKFHSFIGSTNKIMYRSRDNTVRTTIQNSHLTNRLQTLGVVPNKVRRAEVHDSLLVNRDFWRGMVDGDGCVYVGKNLASISLCGTEAVCRDFKKFVGTENRLHLHNGSYYYYVNNRQAGALSKLMYSNCSVALDRKLKSAERLCQRYDLTVKKEAVS